MSAMLSPEGLPKGLARRAGGAGDVGSASPLRPAAQWQAFLSTLGLFAAVVLLGCGLVFFFAYNWDELGRFTRLGIAAGALVLATGLTLCARPHSLAWRAGAVLVAICMGALLALVGQIYQTGADAWELFTAWAALMLPLVLGTRERELWLLWLAVAGMALGRWLEVEQGWWWGGFFTRLMHNEVTMGLGLFYAAMLALFHGAGRWLLRGPLGWLEPVLWHAALGFLCVAALMGNGRESAPFMVLAGLGWVLAMRRRDALLLVAVYGWAVLWSLRHVLEWGDELFLAGLWVLLASGGAASHALQVWRSRRADVAAGEADAGPVNAVPAHAEEAQAAQAHETPARLNAPAASVAEAVALKDAPEHSPWWIQAAMAASAWLAAMLAAAGLAKVFLQFPMAFLAVPTVVAGIWAMRQRPGGVFVHQLGFAMSTIGQLWLASALMDALGWPRVFWLIPAAIALVCSLPRSLQAHRVVCLITAIACTLMALDNRFSDLPWMATILFALAFAGWLSLGDAARHSWARAALHACTFMALALVLVLMMGYFTTLHWSNYTTLRAVAALLWPACLLALVAYRGEPWRWWMVAALALSALAWSMPLLLPALALVLVLFEQRQRAWLDLTLLMCMVLVGMYYYEMNISLLHKSLSMMAAGAAMGVVTWLAREREAGVWLP